MELKKTGKIIGILFLIALILNLIATELLNPILFVDNYLSIAYSQKTIIIIANLLNFICAISMMFIPIKLYPIVQKNQINLAVQYIVFRGLEGILFIYIAVKTSSFIGLSKLFIIAEKNVQTNLLVLGELLHQEIESCTIFYILIFILGGFSFYTLLYKSELIPKFLAIWGIIGISILFIACILAFFNQGIFSEMHLMKGMVYFAPPIALNEFTLSIYLIIKGFKK